MNIPDSFLLAAIAEAEQGLREGGIPIGSVIVHHGEIIGRGHNRRVQRGSAILLYGIPRVVIGENRTFMGEEDLLRSRGVAIEVVDDPTCVRLMREFIAAHPELWNEDIGV